MNFRARQGAFAAHLRDPAANPPPPDLDPRRLQVYRDLFFRNVRGLLRNAFPVCRKSLGDDTFDGLVRAWYAAHHAQTPLFPRVPGEFVAWLHAGSAPDAPAWLADLAHYEYLETELDLSDAEFDDTTVDPHGDLMEGIPVLSPLARTVAYDWPVHRIGPRSIPEAPSPVSLLVYRDRDDRVRFMETNTVTHRLLDLIAGDAGLTGKGLIAEIGDALPAVDPGVLRRAGEQTLAQLRERGVIGVRRR